MSEKTPLDIVLDLMIFSPIGFVTEAPRLVPELAAKGRKTVGGQVKLARTVGEFAVQRGQREAAKIVNRLRPGTISEPVPAPTRVTPVHPATNGEVLAEDFEEIIPVRVEASVRPVSDVVRPDLAIADYDSLAASQVLPLLDNLSPDELEAVHAHESAHRKRKTILGRIAQIQAR
jgi:hypothetical protein